MQLCKRPSHIRHIYLTAPLEWMTLRTFTFRSDWPFFFLSFLFSSLSETLRINQNVFEKKLFKNWILNSVKPVTASGVKPLQLTFLWLSEAFQTHHREDAED